MTEMNNYNDIEPSDKDWFENHLDQLIDGCVIDAIAITDWFEEQRANLVDYVTDLEQENARLREERRWRKYPDEEPESLDDEFQLWSRTYGLVKASFRSWNDYIGYSDITHWVPMPEPPEGGKE